ncbi:MAG: hypothetical protein ABIO70_26855 [Pseudomonadota bacterium]
MRLLVPLALAAALQGPGSARPAPHPGATPHCDGTPPELVNQDQAAHDYSLTCGKQITKRALPAGGKHVLDGFSGCTITIAEQRETLHTEMICTIAAGGKLTCDLL